MIRFKQWAIFKHYLWEIKVSETDISNEKLCKYVKMIYIFKRTMKIVLLHNEYKNFTQKISLGALCCEKKILSA